MWRVKINFKKVYVLIFCCSYAWKKSFAKLCSVSDLPFIFYPLGRADQKLSDNRDANFVLFFCCHRLLVYLCGWAWWLIIWWCVGRCRTRDPAARPSRGPTCTWAACQRTWPNRTWRTCSAPTAASSLRAYYATISQVSVGEHSLALSRSKKLLKLYFLSLNLSLLRRRVFNRDIFQIGWNLSTDPILMNLVEPFVAGVVISRGLVLAVSKVII